MINYKLLFNSTPHLYLIINPDLIIVDVNPAYASATRIKREEVLGRHLFDVFPDNPTETDANGVSNLRASLMYVLETGKTHTMAVQKYDIPVPGSPGEFEERYWSPNNNPVLNEDKQVVLIIHNATDVTKFIQAKQKDADHAERLDHAKKIEAEIYKTAQALVQSNLKLKLSNDALDEFAYIASHDLKEPLRGISNYSSFLMEDYGDKLDNEGKLQLQTLQKLSSRLENMLNNLLKFSRIGRIDLAFTKCDLNSVVSEKIDLLETYLHTNNAKVIIQNQLPSVVCDQSRIGQVFQNLITNGIKYNDNPERIITIDYKDQGDQYIFSVTDNGIGISPEHFDTVFKIFRRLHSRDAYGGGTGAGLTLTKRIIERHGGQIWIESKEGAGTTFYFSINKYSRGR